MTRDEARLVVADAYRSEWAGVLAATIRIVRDLDLAEEAVQDAFADALTSWARDGVPKNRGAWLTTVARRRAIDVLRRASTYGAKLQLLVEPDHFGDEDDTDTKSTGKSDNEVVADDTMRLIYMCCHPALSNEAQMALTLRLVCGMRTMDIARCFLVSESTMAARLTRAKKKITIARIPFNAPKGPDVSGRLDAILGVVYLLFTMGHTTPTGETLVDGAIVAEAIRLARLLHDLIPQEPEVGGLLALLLVNDARRTSRLGGDGSAKRISEQDRSLWDQAMIQEAHGLIVANNHVRPAGRYTLQAAIALHHATASSFEEVDWTEILRLYDALLLVWPSPVVQLNRCVALAKTSGPQVALELVQELESDGRLDRYQYLPAIKAYLLDQLGRCDEAKSERKRAFDLAANEVERNFLASRIP